jgi:hypothetical protein
MPWYMTIILWLGGLVRDAIEEQRRANAIARCDRAAVKYRRARKKSNLAQEILKARDKEWLDANRALKRGGYDERR